MHGGFSFIMDMIRRFFKLLKWYEAEGRPFALEASPLRKLPLELILHIASYLPPESVASLTISCHTLYSCLEMEYLQPLKKAECSVVNRFLRLLDRDLPGHLLCLHCSKFHSMSLAKTHIPSRCSFLTCKPLLACWKVDSESDVTAAIHSEFSSTIFRMVMKAHRQGHDTTNLINHLSYGPMNFVRSGFVEQCSATVRIQDGSLLVREQRVFMIPSSQKFPLPWHRGIDICPHIQFTTMLSLYRYGIQIPHSDEIRGHKNRQGIIYCKQCMESCIGRLISKGSSSSEASGKFIGDVYSFIGVKSSRLGVLWFNIHCEGYTEPRIRTDGSISAAKRIGSTIVFIS